MRVRRDLFHVISSLTRSCRTVMQPGAVATAMRRISRGRGSIALVDQMLVSASNFATGIVLVRGLGLAEFGKYSIAYALLLYANSLQMSFVGSPMLSIGSLLHDSEKRRFINGMLTLQILASLLLFIVFGVAGAVSRVFTTFYSVPCVLLFACCVGTFQLQDWLRRYYFLVNKGKLAIVTDSISYFGQFVILLILWRFGRLTLALTFLVMCVTSVAAVIMGPITDPIRPAIGYLQETWTRCKVLSRDLLIAGQVRWFGTQGILLIGAGIVGSAGIGGLRATQSISGPIYLFLMSLENVVPIHIAKEIRNGGAQGAYEFMQRSILRGTLFFVLLVAPIAIFGRSILRVLYGETLVAFYWPMLLQLLTVLVTTATMLWFHLYRSVQDTRAMLWANALATATNLATVYYFGHLWQASGIVLSSLLGQLAIVACCSIYWVGNQETILARYPPQHDPILIAPAQSRN